MSKTELVDRAVAWAEDHVGVSVTIRGREFELVGVEGTLAVLESEDEQPVRVPAVRLCQQYVRDNAPRMVP